MEVSTGRINLPGYMVAKYADDYLLLEAYQKCRFIGAKMPFIDPLKEVQAARAKLGDQSTPLATYEQVTEDLNGGNLLNHEMEWEKSADSILVMDTSQANETDKQGGLTKQ